MIELKSNLYTKLSYKIFGSFAKIFLPLFSDMKSEMKKADITVPLEEYVSTAILSSFLVFFLTVPIVSIIVSLTAGNKIGIISGLITGFFIGGFLTISMFFFFYLYPSVRISYRKKSIESSLPFAVMYLSTLAGTGIHPARAFEMLGKFKEYGEVSREAEKIAKDVLSFGYDMPYALKKASERTPSEKMKELLWGINNVLSSGGDFRKFLQERTNTLMQEYLRNMDKFTTNLSVFMEIYITLVIVGSVFAMVLSALMGPLGVDPFIVMTVQILGIFLFLPFVSIAFILLIKSLSPVS